MAAAAAAVLLLMWAIYDTGRKHTKLFILATSITGIGNPGAALYHSGAWDTLPQAAATPAAAAAAAAASSLT
jgi:hypothetical protein